MIKLPLPDCNHKWIPTCALCLKSQEKNHAHDGSCIMSINICTICNITNTGSVATTLPEPPPSGPPKTGLLPTAVTSAMVLKKLFDKHGLQDLAYELEFRVKPEISRDFDKLAEFLGKDLIFAQDELELDSIGTAVSRFKEAHLLMEGVLNKLRAITSSGNEYFGQYAGLIELVLNEQQKNQEQTFPILFFGDGNVGKSCLLNLIFGSEVVPVQNGPCTSCLTEISYGPKGLRLIPNPESAEWFCSKCKALLTETSCPRDGSTRYTPLDINWELGAAEYSHFIQIPDGKTKRTTTDEVIFPVKKAILSWPSKLLETGAILVDSPGLNQIPKMKAYVKEYLGITVGIICVIDGSQASLTLSTSALLKDLTARKINIDFVAPKMEPAETKTKISQVLSQAGRFGMENVLSTPIQEKKADELPLVFDINNVFFVCTKLNPEDTKAIKKIKDQIHDAFENWNERHFYAVSSTDALRIYKQKDLRDSKLWDKRHHQLMLGLVNYLGESFALKLRGSYERMKFAYTSLRNVWHTMNHRATLTTTALEQLKQKVTAVLTKHAENKEFIVTQLESKALEQKAIINSALFQATGQLKDTVHKELKKSMPTPPPSVGKSKEKIHKAIVKEVLKILAAELATRSEIWDNALKNMLEFAEGVYGKELLNLRAAQEMLTKADNKGIVEKSSDISLWSIFAENPVSFTLSVLLGVPIGLVLAVGVLGIGIVSLPFSLPLQGYRYYVDRRDGAEMIKPENWPKTKDDEFKEIWGNLLKTRDWLDPWVDLNVGNLLKMIEPIERYINAQVEECKLLLKVIDEKDPMGNDLAEVETAFSDVRESVAKIDLYYFQNFEVEYKKIKFLSTRGALGKGTFGEVSMVEYNDKVLALKEISITKLKFSYLVRELVNAKELSSEFIIDYHGACITGDKLCILTELAQFGSLDRFLEIGEFKIQDLLEIALQIAQGLEFLHEKKKFVHLDIKPSNVLLISKNKVKLADLGLSRYLPDEYLITKCGTPYFMAPELILAFRDRKDTWTDKVDIFAFGVTLWQMLHRKKMTVPPAVKRPEISSEISGWMATLIRDCWDDDPNKRPTATDIIARLRKFKV